MASDFIGIVEREEKHNKLIKQANQIAQLSNGAVTISHEIPRPVNGMENGSVTLKINNTCAFHGEMLSILSDMLKSDTDDGDKFPVRVEITVTHQENCTALTFTVPDIWLYCDPEQL